MGHDQLFKEILQKWLKDFLELFFPNAAARLELESLRFPNKELYKGFPEGRIREPDVVAEVKSRDGEREIVLVHVEVQAAPEADFGKRMLEYYALLWLQFDAPVFPIVLYLKGGPVRGITTAEYRHELFGRELLRFRYASVALARLSAWEYVEGGPLGAALSALMRRGRVTGEEAVELRARMLKRIVKSDLDADQQYLLINVIETYFELSADERDLFQRLVSRKEYREVQDVELTWGDRLRKEGRAEGREEGVAEGVLQGKRETLKRQLAAKFGPLSENVLARIEDVASGDELDAYLDRVLIAKSIEDVGL